MRLQTRQGARLDKPKVFERGDDAVVVDVYEGPAESMSIETEWGCRLILRGMGVDAGQTADEGCAVPFPDPPAEPRKVVGTLPPGLAKLRIR